MSHLAISSVFQQLKHTVRVSPPFSHDLTIFSELQSLGITQREGEPTNAALIHCGLLGTAPVHLTVAVSLCTLELYHRLRRWQPCLSIQSMARALCDVHKVSTDLLSC